MGPRASKIEEETEVEAIPSPEDLALTRVTISTSIRTYAVRVTDVVSYVACSFRLGKGIGWKYTLSDKSKSCCLKYIGSYAPEIGEDFEYLWKAVRPGECDIQVIQSIWTGGEEPERHQTDYHIVVQ